MTQCVKCSLQIVDELFYFVGDVGPELTEIIETDLGHMVSAQDVLCGQCFEHFVQLLSPTQDQEIYPSNETEQEIILPTLRNQCVRCRRSLNRTRRHTLPEGSERDEIAARIQPREIPPNGNVCYACWVSARRNVHSNEEERAGPSHENLMCVLCEISLHRRRTHALRGRMRDDVASRIYPRQVPNHSLVCSMCWNQITQSTDEPMRENYYQEQMTFREFVHTTNSSVQCFVPGCTNNERHTVPKFLRIKILKSTKVFVTDNARVCAEHKTVYDWEFLDKQQFSNTFYKKEWSQC